MFICKMNISYVIKKPTYKLYIFKYTLTSSQTLKKDWCYFYTKKCYFRTIGADII